MRKDEKAAESEERGDRIKLKVQEAYIEKLRRWKFKSKKNAVMENFELILAFAIKLTELKKFDSVNRL